MPLELIRTLIWPEIGKTQLFSILYIYASFFYSFGPLLGAFKVLLLRYITIVVKKRVLAISDDFFSVYLFLLNLTMTFILSMFGFCSKLGSDIEMKFAGLPGQLGTYSPIGGKFIPGIIAGFMAFYGVSIYLENRRQNRITATTTSNHFLNTSIYNEDVFDLKKLLPICVISGLVLVTSQITRINYPIINYTCHSTNVMIIIPMFMYIRNPDMYRFAMRMYFQK